MTGNPHVPLPNGLFFTIAAKHYPLVTKVKWNIVQGHVAPADAPPPWMKTRTLAQHLADAKPGDWMLYKNDNRLDLDEENLRACPRQEWHQLRKDIPIPDRGVRTSTRDGVVWAPRFSAWTMPYYLKRPGSPFAQFFAEEDDVLAYAEELRERFRSGATYLAEDLGIEVPAIRVHAKYNAIPLYPATSLRSLVAPGALTAREVRGFQSAQVVLLVLRFFTLQPGKTECVASLEAIRRIINAGTRETVSDCLKRLKTLGVIDYAPRRGKQRGRRDDKHFQKWACHQVNLKLPEQAADEVPGLFPADLFNDDRFHDLSFKAQSVLIALCLLAKGNPVVTFSLDGLGHEAFIATEKHVLTALQELDAAGLITGFSRRVSGQHLGSLRREMTLGISVLDLLD